jgi:hypothetical protein
VLNVSFGFFFDEMGAEAASQSPGQLQGKVPQRPAHIEARFEISEQSQNLARLYYSIREPMARKQFRRLVQAIAKAW